MRARKTPIVLAATAAAAAAAICLIAQAALAGPPAGERPRAREAGVVVGVFPPGPLNAITDVEGVRVGHDTVVRGESIRTGVTAIIPGPGNLYTHPIPAWIHVGNGYGKLVGETQVREFGRYAYRDELASEGEPGDDREDGSIMIVVATDAPLTARDLDRLAQRAMLGLGRTGSFAHNGSGDYVIAFSTDPNVRRPRSSRQPVTVPTLVNEAMSPLFAATVEATEEAIYNAILRATTVSSSRGELAAIPLEPLLEILDRYGARSSPGD